MPTIQQLVRKGRSKIMDKRQISCVGFMPAKKGSLRKSVYYHTKKPNSAMRKVARVRLTKTGKEVNAYIFLVKVIICKEHSIVMIRGGRVKDLPGVRYHIHRGAAG